MVAFNNRSSRWALMAAAMTLSQQAVDAIKLDISSPDSIKSAASAVADGLMSQYHGDEEGDVPGLLPDPYYWWEAGGMFGAMVDYWHYTGDSTYNDAVQQALLFQASSTEDYMPQNQTLTEGNSDQIVWAMAALSAAETSFQKPADDEPQWLDLAQNVFNGQSQRWDTETCGGGLRWQIFQYNQGYNYKDTSSTAGFFNIASRLARMTGNETFSEWAGRAWDWSSEIGLIDSKYSVFDGTDTETNCSEINHIQWTANAGFFLSGAASMYNFTEGATEWKDRVEGLLKASDVFFKDDIMIETACEERNKCNVDQKSLKSYFARDLAATVKMAPFTRDAIMTKLSASAEAAAEGCIDSSADEGDEQGVTVCPLSWIKEDDSEISLSKDVGSQMAALQIIQVNLLDQAPAPTTASSSGTDGEGDSGSDPSGTGSPTSSGTSDPTSTGAGPLVSVSQVLLASPVLSFIFSYLL